MPDHGEGSAHRHDVPLEPTSGPPTSGPPTSGPPSAGDQALRILSLRHTLPRGVVIRRDSFEAVDLAERALGAAKAEAAGIRAQAQTDAEGIREAARRQGLAEGRRALAAEEVALRAEAVRLRTEAGDRLLRLAISLAERVIGAELRSHPEAILALVRRALTQVAFCRQAVVRLHPAEAASLASAYPALAEAVEGGAELTLRPDPDLAPGDCLVETDGGQVDGSTRVLLASLEAALLAGAARQEPPPPEEETP